MALFHYRAEIDDPDNDDVKTAMDTLGRISFIEETTLNPHIMQFFIEENIDISAIHIPDSVKFYQIP